MIPFSSQLVHSVFSSAMWTLPNGAVSLTFDDGPHPGTTPLILDTLESHRVKGTFFFLGKNIEQYPELTKEVASRGHTVGNHGFDHSLLLFRRHRFAVNQITTTAERIREVTGTSSTLFRPPYGYFRPSLIHSLRTTAHKLVMWNVDPRDWSQRSASNIAARIKKAINPGAIILLHENDNTIGKIHVVLSIVLDSLRSEYEFSTIPS